MAELKVGDSGHEALGHNLYGVQQRTQHLLPNYDLRAGEVKRIGSHPVGGGPAFDIWEGEYLGTEKCAIKVIRGIEVSPRTRDVSASSFICRPQFFTFVLAFLT